MSEPLLSVCLITYNHAKYIKEAIEGVLMQRVDFTWELIIADDFSTDGTREIVIDYKQKYPEFIKLILQEKNVGPAKNWMDLLATPKSKYIAYLEGDDYWIDPLKLQKQVDFLEKNEEYGLIFTDADILFEETGKHIAAYDKKHRRKILVGEVFKPLIYSPNPYKTCTSLFKSEYVLGLNDILLRHRFKIGDKVLWLLIAGKAKVGYIPISTATYRIRKISTSHFQDISMDISFGKSGYKLAIYFASLCNSPINRNRLKSNYRKHIVLKCITNGHYTYLIRFVSHPFLIIKLLIKENIIRKLII